MILVSFLISMIPPCPGYRETDLQKPGSGLSVAIPEAVRWHARGPHSMGL